MNPSTTHCFPFIASLLLLIGGAQAKPINAFGDNPAVNTSGRTVAPSSFEENKGQVRTTAGDAASFVRYRITQGNTSIFLLGNGIAYQFNRMHYPEGYEALESDVRKDPDKQKELDALRKEVRLETYRMDMLLEGANADARITTEGRSHDYTQYYNHDALDVHTYTRVTYHEVYPGIDWVVYTTEKGMEYDFVVQPGADPSKIQLRFKDHEELYVDADGQLIHSNRMGRFTEERPVSFQNGKKVSSRFVLNGDRLSFSIDAYDQSQPLVIDPDRIWATYYGAAGDDYSYSCAVDGSGNVFMAGELSSTIGIASGGHQNTFGGWYDAFLVKFNAAGVRQWGTYYGGTGEDVGYSCATDGSGNVYLAGWTESNTNIGSNGHQNTFAGGMDAFLVKFNANGVRQWSTYYGASADDRGFSCAVDASENVYLAGYTTSTDSISSGGYQNTFGGNVDAFLVKFNANGERLWGTYYGGPDSDDAYSCATDGSGNVYLAGHTDSPTAIASNGHQNTNGGNGDAFLVKFNAGGIRQWGTYYGGAEDDFCYSCATDASGNVYMAGQTFSSDGIASGGHQNTYGGILDAYLVKFNGNGIRQWGTYYGGETNDVAQACAVDGDGNVYVSGTTSSSTAIAAGGYQDTLSGYSDAFLVKFDHNGMRQWGTYYGGTGSEVGYSCTVDGSGDVYLAGDTRSASGIASGGHQNTYGGDGDAFLVKFDGSFVGIGTLSPLDHRITIWPNPTTTDHFYLQAQGTGLAQVQLFDAQGKLQRTEQLQLLPGQAPVEVTFDSELAKGLYMVRVTVEGRSSVAPLVVE